MYKVAKLAKLEQLYKEQELLRVQLHDAFSEDEPDAIIEDTMERLVDLNARIAMAEGKAWWE